MKKLFIAAFVVATLIRAAYPSFAQQMTKQDYLEKSKRQETTGFVLLGAGAVLFGASLVIGNSDSASWGDIETGVYLFVAGGGSMLASIPFFISSGSNARKAAELSFKYQPMNMPRYTGAIPRAYPSLTLTIPIY
ncbi:MAG: hypothetical protein HWE09_09515 [Cyclobacteriaceae bacterium]|nr:hypothetical protein [Cyclobacteriaceae bacterium]